MSALPDHPKHVRLAAVALSMPQRENVLVLGLGGGGMVRELVKDPEIKRLDIVDWSHELPLLLESPRAKVMLEGALNSPKVRLFRCDARVAASLYEEHSFDMVIDNLAAVGWAGSTSVKSVTYFREIKRILKPTGVLVFDPNYSGSPAREAVLAGLMENFQHVQEHETAIVVLASSLPVEMDRHRAEEVLKDRGETLGLSQPYSDWLLQGFKPITVEELKNTPPIVDELLIYEYTLFGKVHRIP
jgi:spermidine synthase